eukprot:29765-Pelagococcus_subviridis.AAC.3
MPPPPSSQAGDDDDDATTTSLALLPPPPHNHVGAPANFRRLAPSRDAPRDPPPPGATVPSSRSRGVSDSSLLRPRIPEEEEESPDEDDAIDERATREDDDRASRGALSSSSSRFIIFSGPPFLTSRIFPFRNGRRPGPRGRARVYHREEPATPAAHLGAYRRSRPCTTTARGERATRL